MFDMPMAVDDPWQPRPTRAKFLHSLRFDGYAILAQQGAGNPMRTMATQTQSS